MTDVMSGNGKGFSGSVSAILSFVVVIGSMASIYSDLNSKMATEAALTYQNQVEIESLRKSRAILLGKIEELKGGAIRTEAEMGSLQKATDRLDDTMKEMLSEMKRMNENLIRLDPNNFKTGG